MLPQRGPAIVPSDQRFMDAESAALRTIYNALIDLDPDVRARVLAWVVDRFLSAPAEPPTRGGPDAAAEPGTAPPRREE